MSMQKESFPIRQCAEKAFACIAAMVVLVCVVTTTAAMFFPGLGIA